jgi:hypothetical protein
MIWLVGTGLWFFLVLVELAFVHSLPFPWNTMPLTLAVGVYLLQHHRLTIACPWLISCGVIADAWKIGLVPWETLSYAAAAGMAWIGAQKLFSHRSYYGLLANALCAFAALWGVRWVQESAVWFFDPHKATWHLWPVIFLFALLFFCLLITACFLAAKHIRKFVSSVFFPHSAP